MGKDIDEFISMLMLACRWFVTREQAGRDVIVEMFRVLLTGVTRSRHLRKLRAAKRVSGKTPEEENQT